MECGSLAAPVDKVWRGGLSRVVDIYKSLCRKGKCDCMSNPFFICTPQHRQAIFETCLVVPAS